MKRLLLLTLALAVLLASLTGCFALDLIMGVTGSKEETFTYNGLNITLPSDFSETSSLGSTLVLQSRKYRVDALPAFFSSITPQDGNEFPTLEEFFIKSGTLKKGLREWDIKDVEGFKVVEHDNNGDGEMDVLCVLLESHNAYWAVKFSSTENIPLSEAQSLYIEWAKTITFEQPATSV